MLSNKNRIILGILILVLILINSIKPTVAQMQEKANYYDRDATAKRQLYTIDFQNELKKFFNYLEEKKFDEAYAMIDEDYKIEKLDNVKNFESFVKRYLIDNDKYGKDISYRYLLNRTEDDKIIYTYEVELISKDFSKESFNPYLSMPEGERDDFFEGRSFTMDVIQNGIYKYKIGLSSKIIE